MYPKRHEGHDEEVNRILPDQNRGHRQNSNLQKGSCEFQTHYQLSLGQVAVAVDKCVDGRLFVLLSHDLVQLNPHSATPPYTERDLFYVEDFVLADRIAYTYLYDLKRPYAAPREGYSRANIR